MTNHDSQWKDEADHYGVLSDAKEIEVDSDVREDDVQEAQVDASLDYFLTSVANQIRRKQDITNVPKESAFDAADMAGQNNDDRRT